MTNVPILALTESMLSMSLADAISNEENIKLRLLGRAVKDREEIARLDEKLGISNDVSRELDEKRTELIKQLSNICENLTREETLRKSIQESRYEHSSRAEKFEKFESLTPTDILKFSMSPKEKNIIGNCRDISQDDFMMYAAKKGVFIAENTPHIKHVIELAEKFHNIYYWTMKDISNQLLEFKNMYIIQMQNLNKEILDEISMKEQELNIFEEKIKVLENSRLLVSEHESLAISRTVLIEMRKTFEPLKKLREKILSGDYTETSEYPHRPDERIKFYKNDLAINVVYSRLVELYGQLAEIHSLREKYDEFNSQDANVCKTVERFLLKRSKSVIFTEHRECRKNNMCQSTYVGFNFNLDNLIDCWGETILDELVKFINKFTPNDYEYKVCDGCHRNLFIKKYSINSLSSSMKDICLPNVTRAILHKIDNKVCNRMYQHYKYICDASPPPEVKTSNAGYPPDYCRCNGVGTTLIKKWRN